MNLNKKDILFLLLPFVTFGADFDVQRHYIRSINIEGNQKTKERVIKREITLRIGDILTPNLIRENENILLRLGLFQFVNIVINEKSQSSVFKDLIIQVKERKSGLFEMGGGLHSDDGAKVFSGLSYRNFGGWNRTLSLHTEINRKLDDYNFFERDVSLSFQEPYLFHFPFIMKGKVSHTKKDHQSFDMETWGSQLSFENRLWKVVRLLFEYEFSMRDIFSANSTDDQKKNFLGLIHPQFFLDFRDHAFHPTLGSLHSLSFEYASPWLGSDNDIQYSKWTGATNWYFPMNESERAIVLALSLRAGYARSGLDEFGIPADKRFYLGGRSTIRGFKEDVLGASYSDRMVKETSFINYKTELRFPIMGDVFGAVFYDGGNVQFNGFQHFIFRESVGFGARYQTPIGPLALDIGYKLDPKDNESNYRIHFSIGIF
ncbi:MAG: BamA/TamA family outer membrane protein [Deltaproteobacteria bacterium]|nr:BamA/TamA family outer membrane protein [Deltaproteobacteria bacterium]